MDIDNRTNIKFDESKLQEVLRVLKVDEFELIFVGKEEIREINMRFRGVDKSTDVLSFPLEPTPMDERLGSVVINLELAQEMSEKIGHKLEDEVALLLVHGVLHLQGYDHEVDDGQMRELESLLLEQLGIDKGLIERSFELED